MPTRRDHPAKRRADALGLLPFLAACVAVAARQALALTLAGAFAACATERTIEPKGPAATGRPTDAPEAVVPKAVAQPAHIELVFDVEHIELVAEAARVLTTQLRTSPDFDANVRVEADAIAVTLGSEVSDERVRRVKAFVEGIDVCEILPSALASVVASATPPSDEGPGVAPDGFRWTSGPSGHLLVEDTADRSRRFTGADFRRVTVSRSSRGPGWDVRFDLREGRRAEFRGMTASVSEKTTGESGQLAVVVNGEVVAAPTLLEPLDGGGQINGGSSGFDRPAAEDLAAAFQSPLPTRLTFREVRSR